MEGMTLGDIVEEIAEKAKHHLGDESIVRKVNNLVAELNRKYKRVPTTSRLDLESGLSKYPLPCPLNNIVQLLVDGTEYKLRHLTEDGCGKFYYYLDGGFGLYPKPEKTISEGILIFHYTVPHKLSVNDMNAEPDIDPDYRMLLVWGVSKDVTENEKYQADFRNEYSALLSDYIAATEIPLPDIRVV